MGYTPITVTKRESSRLQADIKIPGLSDRVGLKDVAVFSRQFATMINSGLSLLRALAILSEQTENAELARVVGEVRLDVERGLPLAVKPSREGSSIGFSRAESPESLEAAFMLARQYDSEVIIERFIDGAELTVAILGSGTAARSLPVIEIRAPAGNYDYQNKYFGDDTRYLCPAPLVPEVAREVAEISLAAYRAIGCEGWGRVDLMLSRADSRPWLLEVKVQAQLIASMRPEGGRPHQHLNLPTVE